MTKVSLKVSETTFNYFNKIEETFAYTRENSSVNFSLIKIKKKRWRLRGTIVDWQYTTLILMRKRNDKLLVADWKLSGFNSFQ